MGNLLSLIYQGSIYPEAGKKIISAETLSLLLEGDEILKKVYQDAEDFKQQVEIESLQLKKEAEEKGFDEGLKKLNAHILALDGEKKRLLNEMNKLVLPLALEAVKGIVGEVLRLHPEVVVNIVMRALAPAVHSKQVIIYVNKEDKALVETAKPEIKAILEQVQSLSVREREDISPGGCVIETEKGIIDASLERQLGSLKTAFEEYVK